MPSLRTLVVVDDDGDHVSLMTGSLEQGGYQVVSFGSGDALIEWASAGEHAVDAVVLDVDMPGRDGYESCRALRALQGYGSTPTVFVSSSTGEDIWARVVSAGGNHFIPKGAEMVSGLRTWLSSELRGPLRAETTSPCGESCEP